jgi:hypothetical protein
MCAAINPDRKNYYGFCTDFRFRPGPDEPDETVSAAAEPLNPARFLSMNLGVAAAGCKPVAIGWRLPGGPPAR